MNLIFPKPFVKLFLKKNGDRDRIYVLLFGNNKYFNKLCIIIFLDNQKLFRPLS